MDSKVQLPSLDELLKAGVQFGHETRRWNPKMGKFIFDSRKNIHILDLNKTSESLEKAVKFLTEASTRGPVIYIGTKRQASSLVREEAIRSHSYFVDVRWAGGLLTNFKVVQVSLKKLAELEKSFDEGVRGRTKFEISRMKKDWQRLTRLYAGVKDMREKPVAAIVVDTKYEKGAVRECRAMGIPVVAIVDTNSDPDDVNYPIPANDDAIKSIRLILKTLSDAVTTGNGGKGVTHNLKDYNEVEVEIVRDEEEIKEDVVEAAVNLESTNRPNVSKVEETKKPTRKFKSSKGILEKVQESKDKSKKD